MNKYTRPILIVLLSLVITSCSEKPEIPVVNQVTLPLTTDADSLVDVVQNNSTEADDLTPSETNTTTTEYLDDYVLIDLNQSNIMWLQESLKIAGFYTSMDGSYGTETKEALIDFQNTYDDFELIGDYTNRTKRALQQIRDTKIAPNLGTDMVFLNKNYYLPSDFIPDDLRDVAVNKNKSIELPSHVATKVEEMFAAANEDGITIYLASGYRSYLYQEGIFSRKVNNCGFDLAQQVVAIPGESEHQTGLAIDITNKNMGFGLEESFDQEEAFDWMIENCSKYGFILRYTKDKTDITHYTYEPWHYRYIGDVDIATYIMENNLVFEEYYDSINQ